MNNIEFVDFVGEAFSDFGFTNFKLYDVGKINSSVGIFQRFYLNGTDKKIGLKYKAIIDRHFERDILRINGFILLLRFSTLGEGSCDFRFKFRLQTKKWVYSRMERSGNKNIHQKTSNIWSGPKF